MGTVTQRAAPPGAPANAKSGYLWPDNRPGARRRGSASLCVLSTPFIDVTCGAAVCHMTRDVQ